MMQNNFYPCNITSTPEELTHKKRGASHAKFVFLIFFIQGALIWTELVHLKKKIQSA